MHKKIYLLGYSDMECFNVVSAYETKETAQYLASELNHALPDIQTIVNIMSRVSQFRNQERPYPYEGAEEEKDLWHQQDTAKRDKALNIILDCFGKRYVNEHLLQLIDFDSINCWSYMNFSIQETKYYGK